MTVVAVPGGSGTDFGVPSAITDDDRRPVSAEEATRLAAIVEAAWTVFERVVAAAPPSCARGRAAAGATATRSSVTSTRPTTPTPRSWGSRSRHPIAPARRPSRRCARAMLDAIGVPSDGSPIAGRKWPPRYAARRIAWHALDHAWEVEDRTEP